MAPETILGESPGSQADVLALGLILYEMILGKLPYCDLGLQEVVTFIAQKEFSSPAALGVPMFPDSLDPILKGVLEKDPERRWTASRLVQSLDSLDLGAEFTLSATPFTGAASNQGAASRQSLKRETNSSVGGRPAGIGREPRPGGGFTRRPGCR